MIIAILKMSCGFLIGMSMAKFTKKHEISMYLGLALVVALTLAACVGIDFLFGEL